MSINKDLIQMFLDGEKILFRDFGERNHLVHMVLNLERPYRFSYGLGYPSLDGSSSERLKKLQRGGYVIVDEVGKVPESRSSFHTVPVYEVVATQEGLDYVRSIKAFEAL